jgi:5-hydroxyisourate hydrolase-like protein (transthyretin family)
LKVTIQVIDCQFGSPAEDVAVALEEYAESGWTPVDQGRTSAAGLLGLWPNGPDPRRRDWGAAGRYRLDIGIGAHYSRLGCLALYPRVIIEFRVLDPSEDLFMPVTISANSLSAYRGCAQ